MSPPVEMAVAAMPATVPAAATVAVAQPAAQDARAMAGTMSRARLGIMGGMITLRRAGGEGGEGVAWVGGCDRRGRVSGRRPAPGRAGSLGSRGRVVDRKHPHPDPLPEGEGEEGKHSPG